jgi:ABC-2 type transport system ATP-binding protein
VTAVAATTVQPRDTGRGDEAVRVVGLRKSYGGRAVLDGVDLVVRQGEIVALLGPNGAGKTTTVEIVEGYRTADGGTVSVLGVDPARGGRALKARVGLMLQGGGMDPRSTPRDVLPLYASFHEGGRDPRELLDRLGLTHVARTRIRRLSGGERQRLALAIALVGDPEVLILDEPTAGMDPEAKRTTRESIAVLGAEGRAILLTTHDLADVERLADRVAILDRGRIVADGTPAELTSGGAAVLRFRLAAPLDDASVAMLGAVIGRTVVHERERGASAYRVEGGTPDPAVIAALAEWCAADGVSIVELRAGAATLEERYLELTGDRAVEAVA